MRRLVLGFVSLSVGALVGCATEYAPPSVGTGTGGGADGATVTPDGGGNGGDGSGDGGSGDAAPEGGGPLSDGGSDGGGMGDAGTGGTDGDAGKGGPDGDAGGVKPEMTVADLVGKLDGHLITMPCQDTPGGSDCQGAAIVNGGQKVDCVNNQLDSVVEYPIQGTVGATYMVKMHFYGIMEPKVYGDTKYREGGAMPPNNSNAGVNPPTWYDLKPAGTDFQLTAYNTYEIHVLDNNGKEVGTYGLNSDLAQGHWTFVINYEKTIPIIGGGKVRVRSFDSNCRQIKNCGATDPGNAGCSGRARTLQIPTDVKPQPPQNALVQPGLGKADDQAGQWFLLDVVSFTGP